MRPRGFTLLEVLVASAILGLALTVILSSEVGLFSSSQRARYLTVATSLSRCKMSEIEAKLLKYGYQLTDELDEGPCCEEEESQGYRCNWKIEKVTLPEMADLGEGGLGSGDGGPLSSLMDMKSSLDFDGGLSALSGMGATFGEAGVGGLAPLLMSFVYPTLKPMLEASIRRVTVDVTWKEGTAERKFELVQFVTDPQQGGMTSDSGAADFGSLVQSLTGSGTGTTTGTTTTTTTNTPSLGGPLGR